MAAGRMGTLLQELYQRLWEVWGPQGWWPGETPFEVAVGAILTQNTNWDNVALAIAALKEPGSAGTPGLARPAGGGVGPAHPAGGLLQY